jgi:phage baseplate assembly protein W
MPLERVSQGFKDISMSFQVNPLSQDLIALKNESAISRSIRNIVYTLPGEKFFNPNFGSGVSRVIFENIDDTNALFLRDEIENSIRNFEPRVELLNVQVSSDFENNGFNVTIQYRIIGSEVNAQQLEFVLQPSR